MISPALKEKFEELFVDEFTEDQYEQWKISKVKRMQEWKRVTYFIVSTLCVIFFIISLHCYLKRDRVEQCVIEDNFCTVIWVNEEIAQFWSTPLLKLTDSLKEFQKKEGERLLNVLNK